MPSPTPHPTLLPRLGYTLAALTLADAALALVFTFGMLYHYGVEGWYGDFVFVFFNLLAFSLFEWLMTLPILLFPVPRRHTALWLYTAAACAIGPIVLTILRLHTASPYSPLAISSPRRIFLTAAFIAVFTVFLYNKLVHRASNVRN